MITFLVMISSTQSQSHKTSPKSLCMTLWLSNSCASDNLGFNLSQVRGNFNSFTGYRKYKQGWRKKWRNHLWKGSKSPVKKSLVEKSPVEKKITCRKGQDFHPWTTSQELDSSPSRESWNIFYHKDDDYEMMIMVEMVMMPMTMMAMMTMVMMMMAMMMTWCCRAGMPSRQ